MARKPVAIAEVFRRWWAGEPRKAGLEGSMDELRARAYLDLLPGEIPGIGPVLTRIPEQIHQIVASGESSYLRVSTATG